MQGNSTVFPSNPAATAFCLLLLFLPSFRHVLLGLVNKSEFLFLTSREQADCQRGGMLPGGGRGRESSSWAPWTTRSITPGQRQLLQMAGLECACLRGQLLFMCHCHHCPGHSWGQRGPCTPGTAAGGIDGGGFKGRQMRAWMESTAGHREWNYLTSGDSIGHVS